MTESTERIVEGSRLDLPTEQQWVMAAIIESAQDCIFAKSLDGRILSWNGGAERMYGYSPGEIVGELVFRLAPPDRREEVASILERVRAGQRVGPFETIRIRKDGERFPVSLAVSPVRDAAGTIVGASTIARDITEQRRLGESLRLMNARLRAVIAAIDDGAIVCAADGRILLRNRVAAELLPDAQTEADVVAALDGEDAAVDGTGAEHAVEVRGRRRWLRLSRHAIALSDGAHAPHELEVGRLLLLRDVTEVRDMQASRDAFSGILSHELRTPITTILGAAKVLPRVHGAAARELLADIGAEADRLYRLVEDLLVLTRVERANLSLADEPVLVGRVIERVLAGERGNVREQRFDVTIDRDLPIVRGDDTYVEQLIRNLVGNALKYGPPTGVISIVAERGSSGVIVRVRDEGPGVRPGETERVFDLLYRSPATEAQASGSGVGLYVSRRLAEAMGGRIWVERRRGRGAEFVVELPLYEIGPEAEAEPRVPLTDPGNEQPAPARDATEDRVPPASARP